MSYKSRAMLLDLILLFSVIAGIYYLRVAIDPLFIPVRSPAPELLVVLVTWFTIMQIEGAYDPRILGTGVQEFKVVTGASFKGFLIVCFVGLATNQHPPRINLFLGWFGSVLVVAFGRKFLQIIMHRKRRSGEGMRNVLIIGSDEYAADMTRQLLLETHIGMQVSTHIPPKSVSASMSESEWLAMIDQSIIENDVQKIIIEDQGNADAGLLSKVSWHITKHNVEMLVAPTFLQQFGPRLNFAPHNELKLVYIDEPELSLKDRVIKRLMDVSLAGIALVILSPFMLLIAIGVYVSNPGPVFFIQDRIGRGGNLFKFIKFRSMVVGAETMRQNVLGKPDEEMAQRYKNDPRIYPFGRFLRRYSLDELPQLVSVLTGKMSVVGPRPILIEELDLLGDVDHRRHLIKPGLTGLWQINGRKETSWEERIQLDLRYVHEWSIGLDLGIIFRTVKVVFSGKGSY
jgi:exopolysaccharide biosynthesis polyprenyl glycosylphosphotransferase